MILFRWQDLAVENDGFVYSVTYAAACDGVRNRITQHGQDAGVIDIERVSVEVSEGNMLDALNGSPRVTDRKVVESWTMLGDGSLFRCTPKGKGQRG